MSIKRLSPVGRIVQGNPLVASPVLDDAGKPKLKDDGTPKTNWWITTAFSKQDPDTIAMIAEIGQEAARTYPQLFPQGYNPAAPNMGCVRADFAMKVVDGDGIDLNGKPHSNKEGWAGHWILKISTYAGVIRCYDGLQNNLPITEPEQIHTGKYVRVSLDIKGNGWTGQGNSKPGMFVNPDGVQLVGHGAKIASGPDAATMFAQPVGGYIPPGMSTTPVASAPMPGQPQAPGPQMQAPAIAPTYTMTAAAQGYTREQWHTAGQTDDQLVAAGYMTISTPAPQMQAPAPQPQMQMPAPGIMGTQPQMQAPAPQPQMQAPAPQMQMATPNPAFTQSAIAPTYTMTAAAQGYTREQWHTAGQNDAALIAAGMMTVS